MEHVNIRNVSLSYGKTINDLVNAIKTSNFGASLHQELPLGKEKHLRLGFSSATWLGERLLL